MRGLGTLVNVAAVLAGSGAGLLAGGKVPERIRETALQGVGLVTLVLGVRESASTHNLSRSASIPALSVGHFGGN